MAGSPKKRERRTRTQRLLADPATLRAICDAIVEGGTLVEWCRQHDVPYTEAAAWIAAEDHRREKFEAARDLRGEFLSELVVRNLRLFADLDIGRAYGADGKLLPVPEMPEDIRRAITQFEVFEEFQGRGEDREYIGDTKKLKTIDPARAVELLGKYRRMFIDRVEHGGKVTLEELVGGSMSPTPTATNGEQDGKPT